MAPPDENSGATMSSDSKEEGSSLKLTPSLRSSSSQTSLRDGYNSSASSDGEGPKDLVSLEAWLKHKLESKRCRVEKEIEQFRQLKIEELKRYEKRLFNKYKSKQKLLKENCVASELQLAPPVRNFENRDRSERFDRGLHGIFTPSYLPLLDGGYFSEAETATPRRRSLSISEHNSTSLFSPPDERISGISAGIASRRHSTTSSIGTSLTPSLKPKSSMGQSTPRQKSPKRVTFKLDDSMPIPSRSSPEKDDLILPPGSPETAAAKTSCIEDEEEKVQEPSNPNQEESRQRPEPTVVSEGFGRSEKEPLDGKLSNGNKTKAPVSDAVHEQLKPEKWNEAAAPSLVQPYSPSLKGILSVSSEDVAQNIFAGDDDDDDDVFDMDETIPASFSDEEDGSLSPLKETANLDPWHQANSGSSSHARRYSTSLSQSFQPSSIRRRLLTKYLPDDSDFDDNLPESNPNVIPQAVVEAKETHHTISHSLPISVSAPPLPKPHTTTTPSRQPTPLPTPSGHRLLNPFSSPKNTPYLTDVAAQVAAQAEAEGTVGVGSVVGGIDGRTGYDEFPEGAMVFGSKMNDGGMSFSMKMRLEEEMERKTQEQGSKFKA